MYPPEEKARAVVYPKARLVACVLLQAVYGGDRRVCNLFDTKQWAVAPVAGEKPAWAELTFEEWGKVAEAWKN